MSRLWKMAHGCFEIGGAFKYLSRVLELMCFIINGNAILIKANIGKGTIFHHHGVGCVVHDNAIIGDNCHIFQNVTLGSRWTNGVLDGGAPIVGNNVLIGAGAVILGDIKIGDNSNIGANAVVLEDVPEGCIAVGVPARIIRKKEEGEC